MLQIETKYTRIEVHNPKFALIHVVSRILSRDTKKLDCRSLVEKRTRQAFSTRFTTELNLPGRETHWYTQFNPENFEALVVVM